VLNKLIEIYDQPLYALFEEAEKSAGFVGLYNIYIKHSAKNAENLKRLWTSMVKGRDLLKIHDDRTTEKKKSKKTNRAKNTQESQFDNQRVNPFVVGSSLTQKINNLLLGHAEDDKIFSESLLAWDLACEYNDLSSKMTLLKEMWKGLS